MKLRLIIFAIFILPLTIQAQDKIAKSYKNEFGIDATSFILLYLKLTPDELTYQPPYYLTYRRKFQTGNIRFAIGGRFANYNIPPVYVEDHNEYLYNSFNIGVRVGWEFKNEISKRWQVFYGLDFRPSFQHTVDDASFWNGGYAYGIDYKVENYGIAPLLGFRFRLNERLSLSTETTFSINFQKQDITRYYTPITSDYAPTPNEVDPTMKAVFSSFSQPLMIFLTFDI